uniref:Uncharacterized protein n=1 Tax=Arundo donax TaxID=35708 RepID=A0A0A9E8V3_ARUDO
MNKFEFLSTCELGSIEVGCSGTIFFHGYLMIAIFYI